MGALISKNVILCVSDLLGGRRLASVKIGSGIHLNFSV